MRYASLSADNPAAGSGQSLTSEQTQQMAIITHKKAIRRLCLATGVIILLCIAAVVLLLPRLINKEMVREKIVHLLSEKISGTVDFQNADISLFPIPRVIIRNASLTIPEKVSGTIRTLTVFPELWPLFHGEVRLSKIKIDGPSFTLRIPAKTDEKTKSLEDIAALLRSLALGAADIRLSVDNGSINLQKSGRPPVSVKEIGLSLDLASTKDSVVLTIDSLSSKDPGLSLSAVFRVSPSVNMISLEAKGKKMDISPLRKAALDLTGDVPVVQNIFTILRGGNVEQIAFQSKGSSLEDLGGTLNINIKGSLTKGEVFVPGPRLAFREVEGKCDIAKGILRASDMTGGIGRSKVKDGALSVGLKGADALFHLDAAVSADLNDVNVILRNVVKDRDFLEELGHVSSINGKAEGRLVLGESLSRIIPRIDIKDMSFKSVYDRVPYPIEIKKGRFTYDEKGADVKDLNGTVGRSSFSGLNAQLGRSYAQFHLDAAVSADLSDVDVILRNVVKNREFLEELGHVRSINGKAEGRLVLGKSPEGIYPRIDIKDMSFKSVYDRVPYPVEIRKGRFSYDEKGAAVKDLEGTVGKSSFSGLDAQLLTGAKSQLIILSGKAGIDTAEMHHWLTSYEKLKASLVKITSLSGRLNISSITFQGLVTDSQAWKFKVAGSAEKLLINTSLLPAALGVNSGKFEVQAGKLTFSDAGAAFLDASSVISGSLDTSLDNVRKGDIRFSGTIGPKALQWTKSTFSIPEYVRVDKAMAVAGVRLSWRDKGEMAFEGNLKTGTGSSVQIDLAKDGDRLTISRLDVSDSVSKASFSFDLLENKIRAGFKGRLDTSTAASLITTPQIQGGIVQGDITAEFSKGDVAGLIAHGRLRGEKIVLPWKKDMPLTIDSVALSADKRGVVIDSARLRLAKSAVSLKGNVSSESDGMVVDMDVSSDRIIWDEIMKQDGDRAKDGAPAEKKKKTQPVKGIVRLNSGIFEYGGFQIAPFTADIVLSAYKTDIKIGKAGLCGIDMTGDISLSSDKAGSETGIDVRFNATNQELKPTILCLSKGKSDATGLFTLKGHVKGHGKAEDFKKVIKGNIEFAARKGTIYRYKTLDSVFDFLNEGEEFRGQMPDLDKSELSYELFKITAAAGNGSLVVEEGIFESAFIEVVAQGTLDLMDNQLDLNVMVAPLRRVNKFIGNTPIVGALLGGSVISVPVKVTGTTADPKVTYLSPSAVASSLAGMMKRTLKLPVNILSPLFPKDKQE
jgi:uncharacterized protein involved in outer membrane biogenesis